MNVREILQAIKDASEEEDTSVILDSDNDQKLIIPLQEKDKRCIEVIEYLANLEDEHYTIQENLGILQDAYWWMQTLAILYGDNKGDCNNG